MKDWLAAVICIVIGSALFALFGPSIVKDFLVDRDALESAPDYRVVEATCETKLFVFSSCDIKLEHGTTNERRKFSYLLFGQMDGEPVSVLQKRDGSYLTTNIGIEYARNRTSMLFIFGGFMLFGGAFLISQNWNKPKRRKNL